MVCRARPTAQQRSLMEDLFAVGELVMTVKHEDAAAVNLHGRFELVDKTWHPDQLGENKDLTETLVGLLGADGEPNRTPTNEPLSHLHVCWPNIHYVLFKPNRLRTIETDHVVRFCSTNDESSWIFAFYACSSPAYNELLERHHIAATEGWLPVS